MTATTPSEHKRFVWSGRLMLLELDETAGTPPTIVVRRKQTWGLDLAGQHGGGNSLESAGGISGLLSIYDTVGTGSTSDDRSFALFYDANGNVGQLLELTAGTNYGSVAAAYEYDAYGNRINAPASGEYEQPWRFSTKQFDAETGLSYYGYRYYAARMGRWTNRDPLFESASTNLMRFGENAPADWIDSDGRQSTRPTTQSTQPTTATSQSNFSISAGTPSHFDGCAPDFSIRLTYTWRDIPPGVTNVLQFNACFLTIVPKHAARVQTSNIYRAIDFHWIGERPIAPLKLDDWISFSPKQKTPPICMMIWRCTSVRGFVEQHPPFPTAPQKEVTSEEFDKLLKLKLIDGSKMHTMYVYAEPCNCLADDLDFLNQIGLYPDSCKGEYLHMTGVGTWTQKCSQK